MVPKGHEEIARAIASILREAFPEEKFGYFYFGNWLTDVSQAIAPVDYAGGAISARRKGLTSVWLARIPILGFLLKKLVIEGKVHQYIRELLGDPPPVNSAMADFFRDFIYVVGWGKFCSAKAAVDDRIDFNEYDRLFHGSSRESVQKRFTQYFPHEHLDRWPMNRTGTSKLGRRLYDFLEEDLRYAAELLTLVDRDWAKLEESQTRRPDPKRHELLVEFGHALHAVEDYFAHSNFVDFALRKLGKPYGDVGAFDQLHPESDKWSPPSKVRERRLLREKNPRSQTFEEAKVVLTSAGPTLVGEDGRPVPPGETEPETDVVTGYFDSIDTSFSMAHLYEDLMEEMRGILESGRSADSSGPEDVLDWRKAKTADERNVTRRAYQALQALVRMPQKVCEAQFRYMETDWRMIDKWGGNGPSWVLEQMIKEGEQYQKMTFADGSKYSERIGSHTLIAKDAEDKYGNSDAISLSKSVGAYVAETMIRNVRRRTALVSRSEGNDNRNSLVVEKWVDWLELLRYYCCHPEEAKELAKDAGQPVYWWSDKMSTGDQDMSHTLRFINKAEVDRRARLDARKRLEKEHNSMIAIEQAKYKGLVSGAGEQLEKTGQLAAQQASTYEQKGVDRGSVRVKCVLGRVEIQLYTGLKGEFTRFNGTRLGPGETWQANFPDADPYSDESQTNRTVVTGLADQSTYEISMASY